MSKENPQDSTKLAGKTYDIKDYQQNDFLSAGLAETHEQVSDAYMEGEIGAVIDNFNGKDIPMSPKKQNQKEE